MAGEVRVLEHTGDAAIEARADDLRELFETAARGMLDLIAETEGVRETVEIPFRAEGEDLAELLVHFLAEALWLHDAKGLLFRRVEVAEVGGGAATGTARGEPYDPARHVVVTPLKAVTHHGAEVVREGDRWRARVVFDL